MASRTSLTACCILTVSCGGAAARLQTHSAARDQATANSESKGRDNVPKTSGTPETSGAPETIPESGEQGQGGPTPAADTAPTAITVPARFQGPIDAIKYDGATLSGCSHYGEQVYGAVVAAPARFMAFVPLDAMGRKPGVSLEWARVPGMLMTAAHDVFSGNSYGYEMFLKGRAQNAPWTYVQRPGGHCKWNRQPDGALFVRRWLTVVEGLRTPRSDGTYRIVDVAAGWLGGFEVVRNDVTCDPRNPQGGCRNLSVTSAWVASYANFQGDKSKAAWLPNQELANEWLALMRASMTAWQRD